MTIASIYFFVADSCLALIVLKVQRNNKINRIFQRNLSTMSLKSVQYTIHSLISKLISCLFVHLTLNDDCFYFIRTIVYSIRSNRFASIMQHRTDYRHVSINEFCVVFGGYYLRHWNHISTAAAAAAAASTTKNNNSNNYNTR